MPKTKTRVWDPAEHLITGEDMAAYLEAALQEGDPALIAAALGDIARAKGMSQIARDAGLGRERPLQGAFGRGQPRVCNHHESHRSTRVAIACSTIRYGRVTSR